MRPFLFHIGDLGVPSFFFMIMVGSLFATFFASYMAKREKADPVVLLDFGIIAIICSVIGSRVFHILVESPMYYWEHPIRVFYFWQGGFVSIGAYIGSIIGFIVYIKKRHLNGWRYFDLAALSLPVIIFFVRMGCLCAGCCYGKPTNFPIHLVFDNPSSTAGYYHLHEPLHATQPYFMLSAIVMWVVLLLTYRYRKFYGQVLATFFIYYGMTRFLIEFLRGDADRGMWFGGVISTGQIAMICASVVGVLMYLFLGKKNRIEISEEL